MELAQAVSARERGEGGSHYTPLLDPKTQTHSPILTIIDPIKEEVKKKKDFRGSK